MRVIPLLLLEKGRLVKTLRFAKRTYVGDPINTVKLFNDKEVDEVVLLDIMATRLKAAPDFELIREIAGECFMPIAYGGGVKTVEQARRIFDSGVEKTVLNAALFDAPLLIGDIAKIYGSQAVVASIDAKRGMLSRRYSVFTHGGKRKTGIDPVEAAKRAVDAGAGEILIGAIDRDGTMQGYDLDLVRMVADAVPVPVIASGGAGSLADFVEAIGGGHASAVAAGAMFVFKGAQRAVLVNYPTQPQLRDDVYTRI